MKSDPGKIVASAGLCLLLGLLLASCAQTGPPLPPSLELPKPPTDLRAIRKGNRVTLDWSEPVLTTDRQSVRYLGPTLVCRSLDSEITACPNPLALLPAPPADREKLKASQGEQPRKSQSRQSAPQTYTDILPSALQQPDPVAEITYAVEVLNRNARGAGFSNRVHVAAVVTLPPPTNLLAELAGEGVVLTWTSSVPSLNDITASPAIQFRYRIYRRDQGSGKDAIAGEVPLDGPGTGHFTDSSFEWEKTYLYRITTVSIVRRPDSEVQVEGDDGPPVRVAAHDVFPPEVPSGLQAAYSGEGQKLFIDLIWAPVTDADLAGYNVYRSEANTAAVKLNPELVKAPAYRDISVASGKTYSYSVSAVDVRGNESQRSAPASETVP